jgi:PII-like signaling protein
MMPWCGDHRFRELPSCPRLMASAQAQRDRSAAVDEDAAVLTSYFRDRHGAGAKFLGGALVDGDRRPPVAAGILVRGIEGYGPGRSWPGSEHVSPLSDDPPLTAVAVDTRPRIEALLDEVAELTQAPLITLERARLLSGEIEPLRLGESATEATRLTIYCSHADRVYQVPAFEAACELLYRRGIAGATVLSGTDGIAGGPWPRVPFPRHGDAPLMVVAVSSGERIGMVLPELGGLFRHPLMTVTTVRACLRDGQFINRPETLPDEDAAAVPAGMASRVKLTVYTSEAARHDGQPVHRAIVHRLRSTGVSGATSVRGIWGFHGDHAPHGDHFRRHGHHVPVVTTVVDAPERIAAAFDVIAAFGPRLSLVTAQAVLTPELAGVPADQGS